MTLQQFKNEFRLRCTDTYPEAKEAWFECVGRMNRRGLHIPSEYKYINVHGDGTEKDSPWYVMFGRSSNKQLEAISTFLFRYLKMLKRHGRNNSSSTSLSIKSY